MSLNKKLLLKKETHQVQDFLEVISILKTNLTTKNCILLKGDLAAGKSTFVSEFCRSYGIETAASPTFALHHVYENSHIHIDHFDLYRLKDADEIETSGLWEVLAKSKVIAFIEWSERIDLDDIPLDCKIFEIQIEKISESSRLVSISSFN